MTTIDAFCSFFQKSSSFRLRRSFRDSIRRRGRDRPQQPPNTELRTKTQQRQADEVAVRLGTCSFDVQYLGCVEVFESRGMEVCEEALDVLRVSQYKAELI